MQQILRNIFFDRSSFQKTSKLINQVCAKIESNIMLLFIIIINNNNNNNKKNLLNSGLGHPGRPQSKIKGKQKER